MRPCNTSSLAFLMPDKPFCPLLNPIAKTFLLIVHRLCYTIGWLNLIMVYEISCFLRQGMLQGLAHKRRHNGVSGIRKE
jgi:hypothetical protein